MQISDMVASETHLRSFLKGFSWRIWGTVISIIVSYYFIGELKIALEIGAAEFIFKIFLFYSHERVWSFIGWGIKVKPAKIVNNGQDIVAMNDTLVQESRYK